MARLVASASADDSDGYRGARASRVTRSTRFVQGGWTRHSSLMIDLDRGELPLASGRTPGLGVRMTSQCDQHKDATDASIMLVHSNQAQRHSAAAGLGSVADKRGRVSSPDNGSDNDGIRRGRRGPAAAGEPGDAGGKGPRIPRIGILVVAYNAESTLASVLDRVPKDFRPRISKVFVCDDASGDSTHLVALGYQQLTD